MKTFFIEFRVVPTPENRYYNLVGGALAACWVLDADPTSARAKASLSASKYDWNIEKIVTLPVEVTQEHFLDRDIGLEQFVKAQKEGISIYYTAWARDGKTTVGPILFETSSNFNLADFLKTKKQLTQSGRCLHYDSGNRCNKIISAHSIQKNQSLSKIADKGHVYGLSRDFGSLEKNNGHLIFKKYGINEVSNFLGFCKKHDNELFKLIDDDPLLPTKHQVMLYAYRSLCRGIFVKENALNLSEDQFRKMSAANSVKDLLSAMRRGTAFGLENLKRHKSSFDHSLREMTYKDIRYVIFVSTQNPIIAFSGLFYPDFDFMGRQLQNLGEHEGKLDLLTICSAPMKSGWGFIFAWHKSSSKICVEFLKTLATKNHEGHRFGDLLFRLAISNCENLTISPQWWEKLSMTQRRKIELRASEMANILSVTQPSYLMEGLENISPWNFKSVKSHNGIKGRLK